MCKYLLENNECSIRKPDFEGHKNAIASTEIHKAFMDAAVKSPHYKDVKIGVGCGAIHCCFSAGKYASWKDCPYYHQ